MLKNFKNLKGAQVLSKNEQKAVNGGGGDEKLCQVGYHRVCGFRGDWCGTVTNRVWVCECVKITVLGGGEIPWISTGKSE